MKNLLLFCGIIFLTVTANAQLTYEQRLEFELKNGYGSEKILNFGELGMILRSERVEDVDGQKEIKFEKYSTDLELEETQTFLLDDSYRVDRTITENNVIHSLFRNKKSEYLLHSIEAGSLEQRSVPVSIAKGSVIHSMVVVGQTVYLYIQIRSVLELHAINWSSGKVKISPIQISGFKTSRLKFMRFQVIQETDEAILFIRANTSKKVSEVHVLRFDDEGGLISSFTLPRVEEKNFTSLSASPIGDNEYILTGTYSSSSSTTAEGLFFCETDNGKVNYCKFYNFTQLENFFKYLPERQQEKIEKKKNRKAALGKELVVNYLIAEHPVIVLDDGYLFLGEAYYPTYRTEYYTTYSNGVPVTKTRQVFDGFQYTHAVLAKFNKEGEKEWDEIFEMYPSYKPYSVRRFISIAQGDQDALNLVFANRNTIVSKSFSFDGEVIYDKTSDPIETNLAGDETKRSFANISYWYDDYFLAYGSQVIKNKEDKDNKKRSVYFISKIRFE